MKRYSINTSVFLLVCALNTNFNLQAQCDTVDVSFNSSRSNFSCPDMDKLTYDEVLAMPILYIPVLFHFVEYKKIDSGSTTYVNFTCDPFDPILGTINQPNYRPLLYAPTFANAVLTEMNTRMADQLNEDPAGLPGSDIYYSDTRIRYYALNGNNCDSYFFYDEGTLPPTAVSWNSLPNNVINIVFNDNNAPKNGGEANVNFVCQAKNYARSIYNDMNWNSTELPARLTNHEVGHQFGLDHTYNCANICRYHTINNPEGVILPGMHCCGNCIFGNGPGCAQDSCTTDYLMGGTGYLFMTLCEHRIWWSNRQDTPFEFSDFCNTESEVEELIYDTGSKLVWSGQRLINADVIIKNGTEIEITCDVYMGENKKIIVERGARLIINGGSIRGLCDYKWQGIIIEGVSDPDLLEDLGFDGQLDNFNDPLDEDLAGTVVIRNSTISDAITAISMYNSQFSFPDVNNYFGGLIYGNDATFTNCDRAVEFMRYGYHNIRDKSEFIDCTFENLNRGVTLWANNGVVFDNCTFDHCGLEGILAYDSQIEVINGCDFNTNLNALVLFNTFSNPYEHIIGSITTNKNEFINNHYGIYGNAVSSIRRTRITNNRFEDNDFGMFFGGISHYISIGNHYENLYLANELVGTGYYNNVITSNYMESNDIAISYVSRNEGSTFLHNCFVSTDDYDVVLNNTTIFPIIGTGSNSAGNCFSLNSIPSILCNTNLNNVTYASFGSLGSCYNPNISNCGTTVTKITATNNQTLNCDPEDNPLIGPESDCPVLVSNHDLVAAIASYDSLITAVIVSSVYTAEEKRVLLTSHQKCISSMIFEKVRRGLDNDTVDFEEMIDSMFTYLSNRPEFNFKINAYGLRVFAGQYSAARTFLNGLSTSDQDEIDYKYVQNINLDYLNNFSSYSPSEGVLDSLEVIGLKHHPYTGFARSLYHLLTGEIIQPDIPDISGVILPRSIEIENDWIINSYPNPVTDNRYSIQIEYAKYDQNINITVFDIYGRPTYSSKQHVTSNTLIEVKTIDWVPGIYFLSMKDSNGSIIYLTSLQYLN